jgi:hypothetical protein
LSELPKLVDIKVLNHNFPGFPTDALLDLVKTYGLPDLVTSLESLTHSFPGFSGGGRGGGGGSPDVPTDVLPALVMLLEFLKQNLPDSSGHGLSDVLTNVLPALVQSLGIPHTPAAPLPEAQVSAPTEAPVEVVPGVVEV